MVREVNKTYSSKLMRGYFPWAFQHSKQIKCLFIKKKEKKKKETFRQNYLHLQVLRFKDKNQFFIKNTLAKIKTYQMKDSFKVMVEIFDCSKLKLLRIQNMNF